MGHAAEDVEVHHQIIVNTFQCRVVNDPIRFGALANEPFGHGSAVIMPEGGQKRRRLIFTLPDGADGKRMGSIGVVAVFKVTPL